jgi:hypothetical protein
MKGNLCMDDMQQKPDGPYNMGAYGCHTKGNLVAGSQLLSLTNDGVFRSETSCATIEQK